MHYLAQLASAVSKYAEVVVIGPRDFVYDYFSPNIRVLNVLDCSMKGRSSRLRKVISLVNLNLLKATEPDVIHITDAQPLIALGLFLTRLYGKSAMVYTNHEPRLHADERLDAKIGSFLNNHLIKYDRIIVHGECLKEILVERGFSENRVRVIPHGSYSLFRSLFPRKNIVPEKNTILFFGTIRKYKGLEYLIRAASLVSKELSDLKVIIAGEGDLSSYSKMMTDKSRFEVHNGSIPDGMVQELFDRSQLLVLPYIEATQSGPLHIAYALKKPVVATNVGTIPDAVKHYMTGLLVPPRDEKALAEAIVTLLKNDELRARMGENADRMARGEFSWDTIAKSTIKVYEEAIGARLKREEGRSELHSIC